MASFIGGSGLYQLDDDFVIQSGTKHDTPFGPISSELALGQWHGYDVAFLPRHGRAHRIPPHRINYRANLWALKNIGVTHIIAVNAVGGITANYSPGTLGLPDQIIDYTTNRVCSFSDSEQDELVHIDFTWPYSEFLRSAIQKAATDLDIDLITTGVYGSTNGPRLETAAEIRKMAADGCDMIGMTGMPEAALARELDLQYATIALVVNRCAGLDDKVISMDDIQQVLTQGMSGIRQLILATLTTVNS